MRINEDRLGQPLPDPMLGSVELGPRAGGARAGVIPALRPTIFCPSPRFEACLAERGC